MAILKKANTYYAYFRDIDGRQVKRSLHTGDLDIAKAREKVMKEAIRETKFRAAVNKFYPEREQITTAFPKKEIPQGEHHRGSIALDKMWDVAITRRELSARHLKEWRRFCQSLPQNVKYADQITPKIVLSYLESNYSDKTGKTYNNIKTMLNSVFRLCLVEANLTQSPFAAIPNRRIKNVEHHRALTEAEFVKAFRAAAEPWKTASLISWHTALRRETCFRLAWEHIDTADNPPSITIMPGKTARFGRAVYIPIHPQLYKHLCNLPRPESDKTPILSQFRYIGGWKKENRNLSYYSGLLKSLDINDTSEGKASFHSLRASFITRCDEAGISRRATRSVAGQTADNITDLYSHDKETAKKILDLPPADL